MATGSIDEDPFVLPERGRIVRYTGPETQEVVAAGLNFPIAFAFGADEALYVASPAMGAAPGTATIARLELAGATMAAATPITTASCFAVPAA